MSVKWKMEIQEWTLQYGMNNYNVSLKKVSC